MNAAGPLSRLDLGEATSREAVELAERVARWRETSEALDRLGREQRAAREEVRRLSGELRQMERRAAGGEEVTAKEREAVEAALRAARARVDENWSARRAGLEDALRDREQEARGYAREAFRELLDEHEAGCGAAAARVDELVRELLDAIGAYGRRERALHELVVVARGRTAYGDFTFSNLDAVNQACKVLVSQGGTSAPRLLRDRPDRDVEHDEVEAVA
jgi:hypothetical protein